MDEDREAKLRMALKLPKDEHLHRLLDELPKIEPKLKEGQRVKVYHDPLTKKDYEGTAALKGFSGIIDRSLEWWLVKFENGDESFRWIDTTDR